MKFLVSTMAEYVMKQVGESSGIHRFVLPSYPSRILIPLGELLMDSVDKHSNGLSFEYGIAYGLGRQWEAGSEIELADLKNASSKGWYNSENNLTRLRNLDAHANKSRIVLLAGYEHIPDQASLRDFFQLNEKAIWEICLQKSFSSWVQVALRNRVDVEDGQREIRAISEMLRDLYHHGSGDLVSISLFLEQTDFSTVMTATDALRVVADNLGYFGLPRMPGIVRGVARRSVKGYITPAQEFFNYARFLDAPARDKALARVKSFRESHPDEVPDDDVLGPFASLSDMLDSLVDYVQNNSPSARDRLRSVDFVYLHDRVLNYRMPRQKRASQRVRRIRGLPPEVFLRAIWISLGEMKREIGAYAPAPATEIQSICLQSISFRHDLIEDEDSEEKVSAEGFLRQILGGIDSFLRDIEFSTGEDSERHDIAIRSVLEPSNVVDGIAYQCSVTAEPQLRFEVAISGLNDTYKREYVWSLPKNHQSRLLVDLYSFAYQQFSERDAMLPVFCVPYLPEMLTQCDEDGVNRVMDSALKSSDKFMADVLPSMTPSDPFRKLALKLSQEYQTYLARFVSHGFFDALARFDELRQSYCEIFGEYLSLNSAHPIGSFLMKSFLVVSNSPVAREKHRSQPCLESGVVTPLHPALIDMLRHQHIYLVEGFTEYARRALESSGNRLFSERVWNRLVDLSKVQWPLFGLLVDENLVLGTSMKSHGYLHVIGNNPGPLEAMSSRLFEDYDEAQDDDVSDSGLFRETRCSRLVDQVLQDYEDVHPYAADGISVGAYCGGEIQPIIAGIDSYLDGVFAGQPDLAYALNLVIFSDGTDDSSMMKWLNAWDRHIYSVSTTDDEVQGGNCSLSISYRVLPSDRHQFVAMLEDSNLDVFFFTDFIQSGVSHFEPLGEVDEEAHDYRKFPLLEKTACVVEGKNHWAKRERVISNDRFRLAWLHLEAMARIRSPGIAPRQKHMIVRMSDYSKWTSVVSAAHRCSGWVVCVDPSVDERLLREENQLGHGKRDIIGFGTGVGPHGESNFTVSTEHYSVTDIRNRMADQINALFGPLAQSDALKIAKSLIEEASSIGGLSIVKATGPSQYVRDYIAYSLARKLLPPDRDSFCDTIVSLDGYRHWFDGADTGERPDLLHVRARIKDGRCELRMRLIECKIANQSEGYLEKARQQVESGLRRLIECFRPAGTTHGLSRRPAERYWWMQLHRIVSTNGRVSLGNRDCSLQALERLSDGDYSIAWQADVLALWTDVDGNTLESDPLWVFPFEGKELPITVIQGGKKCLAEVCLGQGERNVFSDEFWLQYSAVDFAQSDDPAKGTKIGDITAIESPATNTEPPPQPSAVEPDPTSIRFAPPDRILLGKTLIGNKDVFWEFNHPDLPNRHILIFGSSGTGKTYTIQALMGEVGKTRHNCLVVDYTNGFTNNQLDVVIRDKLHPKQHVVQLQPLSINPFRRQSNYIDDLVLPENPATTGQRIAGVFSEVYQLGDQQKSALYTCIKEGVESEGDGFSLTGLLERLEALREAGGPVATSAASVVSKIQPFVDMKPFGKEGLNGWEKLFLDADSRCQIIQLAGFAKDTARLITEFTLIDLYWYYRAQGSQDRPRVIVLDEIQNLDHRLESPLGQFLTEGRKFGISLVLATQTLSNLDKDQRDRLFQASHKLFFKPADTEVRSFAGILADATRERVDDWVDRLSRLKRGECYSLGHAVNPGSGQLEVNRAFKIRIEQLEHRF